MQSQNVKTFEKRNQTESITDTYNRLLKYVKGDDEIDESDFDVTINYRGGDNDVDMEEEYSDIEDFDVSDDN